jgi:hypothetical protein
MTAGFIPSVVLFISFYVAVCCGWFGWQETEIPMTARLGREMLG